MKKVRNSKAKRGADAKNKSWVPGRKGQGGEGLSKGYGGSAGDGTGASGPESGQRSKAEDDAQAAEEDQSRRGLQPVAARSGKDRTRAALNERRIVRALAWG